MRAALIVGLLLASVATAQAAPDASEHEAGAYVFVIDRSSSMRGDRLDLVKAATLEVIGKLDPTDQVAVVSFAAQAEIVVPLGDASRRGLGAKIARIHAGRGDDVASGVTAAFKLLARQPFDIRHVVVLTDSASTDRIERMFDRMPGRFTVSAIGFETENRALPQLLATRGNGTAYTVEYLEMLPRTLLAAVTPRPVRKGQAVVFLVDRSGSMEGAKLAMAVEVVRVCLEVLAPTDIVSVIAFDTTVDVIVRPQLATNRVRVSGDVAKLTTGGGTDFFRALQEARMLLANIKAGSKIVVVISDGESPRTLIAELVHDMLGEGISTSAVGLAGADRTLLTAIADAGNGRLYMVEEFGSLPKMFFGDTSEPAKRF